ncbi:MAG: YybH family protein, partial [Vicinamibacteria bacterium]
MQPVLQARVPARTFPLHARAVARAGLQSRALDDADELMAKARTPPIYTTPQDAATAFYQAFEARDLDAMMATWADDEEIVCVHPGAQRLVGYDA